MSDQIDLFSIDEAIVAIEKQKEHRGEPVIDEDFFGDTGQDEAKARLEARRGGAKFGETGPGFKAFNPINRTAADMVSDYAEHGDAEKTGGVPAKRKTINHTKNYKKYIEALFPDAIELHGCDDGADSADPQSPA